ncbi:MAG: triose-phosphate isomerase [Gemmatimonadales bacterium]
MRPLLFAANWKMHIAPDEARAFAGRFLELVEARKDRDIWFFPGAVSIEAAAGAFKGREDIRVGAQDVYYEEKGAFTGATSVALAQGAGATVALVGHSERRHVFGETDDDTRRKVRALLDAGMIPLLCVGELLKEREEDETEKVVIRQLGAACSTLSPDDLSRVVVAYEPVWAIGTGKNATPSDAAAVHGVLREELESRGHRNPRILYGGSVNAANIAALLAEAELDGVLVGGASLKVEGWAALINR